MSQNTTINRRRMLSMGAGCVGGLAAQNAFGSSRQYTEQPPNILFVFSDQQRRHALGFMGEDPVITPHTDRFASESLVFNNAISAYPLCTPYRASLLTGRYPLTTGVDGNGKGLRLDEVTIGAQLKQAGYQTGYIGKWHLYDNKIPDYRDWHFNQNGQYVPPSHRFGFDYWHGVNCNHRTFWQLYYENSTDPAVCQFGWQPEHDIDTAVDYLRTKRTAANPFALFVSMVPPHNTHGPGFAHHEPLPGQEKRPHMFRTQHHAPEEYETLYEGKQLERRPNVHNNYGDFALSGYFGACTGLDEQFGRLLQCLEDEGLADNTIVVYTADHGDMMGSHNRFSKGVWYEESIGIPFIIRLPGRIAPGKTPLLFNSVDVMPSLLGLAGLSVPKQVEGIDCSAAMQGHSMTVPASVFTQTRSWKAVRTEQHTFLARPGREAESADMLYYDLKADPYQMKPQREERNNRALFQSLKGQLHTWLERTRDPFARFVQ